MQFTDKRILEIYEAHGLTQESSSSLKKEALELERKKIEEHKRRWSNLTKTANKNRRELQALVEEQAAKTTKIKPYRRGE